MKLQKTKLLIALGLTFVLMLPSMHQWLHLVESHHQEVSCHENSLHYHQLAQDCSLKFTFTTPYTLTDFTATTPFVSITWKSPSRLRGVFYRSNQVKNYFLRGPPPFIAI